MSDRPLTDDPAVAEGERDSLLIPPTVVRVALSLALVNLKLGLAIGGTFSLVLLLGGRFSSPAGSADLGSR